MRDNLVYAMLLVVFALLMVLLAGCANIRLERDSTGAVIGVTSYGFLRTAEYSEKRADGSAVGVSTQSQTGDVLLGMNTLIGTMTATAEKLGAAAK